MTTLRTTLYAALALAAGACSSSTADDPGTTGDGFKEVADVPVTANRDVDILFVVDNSNSMADKQAALATSFPRMMDVLAELDGGIPNLHIGVITTDVGAASLAGPGTTGAPGCTGNGWAGNLQIGLSRDLVHGSYISDVADATDTRVRNYDGALRDAFGGLAQVGIEGCGFEAPFLSLQMALAGNPANAGFLRADANLAVIFVTDEDDCSAVSGDLLGPDSAEYGVRQSFRCTKFGLTCDESLDAPGVKTNCVPSEGSPLVADVQPFIDSLLATKASPNMIMVAAIAGNVDPVAVELRSPPGSTEAIPALAHSCTYTDADGAVAVADPAVRIKAFLDAFPGRSTFQTICDGDFTGALVEVGDSAKKLVGDPCVETVGLVDGDPARAGVQPICEAVDTLSDAFGTSTPLVACTPDAHTDCYELTADAALCPRQLDHLRITVQRSAAPLAGTRTHIRCKV